MDEEQLPEPKISTADAVIIGLVLGILDVVDFIPLGGDVTDLPASLLLLYYRAKGISGTVYAMSLILDLIPIIQEFPTRSLAWWVTVYMDRHPTKIGRVIETAGEMAQGKEGELGAGEAGAAAEGVAAEGAVAEGSGAVGGVTAEGNAEVRPGGTTETGEAPKPEGAEGPTPKEVREKAEMQAAEGEAPEPEEGGRGEKEEDISAAEPEQSPEKVLEKKLLEETPTPQDESENDDEEDGGSAVQAEPPRPDNEEFEKKKKALEEKQQLQSLKAAPEATGDQDVDTLKKAA